MDAKAYQQTCDGMDGGIVAVASMMVMLVMMFFCLFFLFAAGAVVMAMLGTFGELLQQQLDEESQHDCGSNLEVDAWGDEAEGLVAKEHVGDKIDETGRKQECTTENGDVIHGFRTDMTSPRYEDNPNNDAHNNESVG